MFADVLPLIENSLSELVRGKLGVPIDNDDNQYTLPFTIRTLQGAFLVPTAAQDIGPEVNSGFAISLLLSDSYIPKLTVAFACAEEHCISRAVIVASSSAVKGIKYCVPLVNEPEDAVYV